MLPITTDHGVYNFLRVYKGQAARDPVTKERVGENGGMGELDSGAWVYFPQCLPITDPKQALRFLESVNTDAAARFKGWWNEEQVRAREEAAAPVARPIKIVACDEEPGSNLVYDDGTEEDVEDAGAVLAFFKEAGALQDFALMIFGARYKVDQAETIREELETPRAKLAREIKERQEATRGRSKRKRGYTRSRPVRPPSTEGGDHA